MQSTDNLCCVMGVWMSVHSQVKKKTHLAAVITSLLTSPSLNPSLLPVLRIPLLFFSLSQCPILFPVFHSSSLYPSNSTPCFFDSIFLYPSLC